MIKVNGKRGEERGGVARGNGIRNHKIVIREYVDKNKYFSDVAILISAMLNILSRESNLLIISYTGFLFVARVTLFGTKEFFELTVNALKLILVM